MTATLPGTPPEAGPLFADALVVQNDAREPAQAADGQVGSDRQLIARIGVQGDATLAGHYALPASALPPRPVALVP